MYECRHFFWYITLTNRLFLIFSPQVSDRPQRRQTRGPQKDAQCLPKPRFLQEGFPRAEDALFLQARQCELPTIPYCFFFVFNQLVLPNSRYLRAVPMVPLAGAWLAPVVPWLLVPGKPMSYEGWCQCPRSLASKLTSGALSLFLHRCCQLWIFCSLHTSTTLRKCILNRKLNYQVLSNEVVLIPKRMGFQKIG